MKTYDFNLSATDLEGKTILDGQGKEVLLWQPLSLILSENSTDNYIKHIGWALSLTKDKVIQIDEQDTEYLLNLIKSNRQIIDLVKYQIYTKLKGE